MLAAFFKTFPLSNPAIFLQALNSLLADFIAISTSSPLELATSLNVLPTIFKRITVYKQYYSI
jgi:hypothetical protein